MSSGRRPVTGSNSRPTKGPMRHKMPQTTGKTYTPATDLSQCAPHSDESPTHRYEYATHSVAHTAHPSRCATHSDVCAAYPPQSHTKAPVPPADSSLCPSGVRTKVRDAPDREQANNPQAFASGGLVPGVSFRGIPEPLPRTPAATYDSETKLLIESMSLSISEQGFWSSGLGNSPVSRPRFARHIASL